MTIRQPSRRQLSRETTALFLMAVFWPLTGLGAEVGYWTRGVPGESTEYKIALAENGRPLWYVLDKDTTLDELLKDKCGEQPEEILNYYREESRKINAIDDVRTLIAAGNAVAIPYCHKVERNVRVPVRDGDTIDGILRYRFGLHGEKSIKAVVAANLDDPTVPVTGDVVSRFSAQLRRDSVLTIPYASDKRMFIVASGGSSPIELLREHPPSGIRYTHVAAAYEMTAEPGLAVDQTIAFISASPEPEVDPNIDESALQGSQDAIVEFVNIVTLESGQGNSDCPEANAVEHYDAALFLQRLAAEKAVLEGSGRSVGNGVVGIIDSGLRAVGQGIFGEELFEANEAERLAGSVPDRSDDGNAFKDDVWGVNFVDYSGEIRPFQSAWPKRTAHGSQVASLVLGGISYLSMGGQASPMTKLIVVNFGDRLQGIQPPEKLFEAVDYLVERDSDIINMSLSAEIPLLGLKERIDRQKAQVLFVVAAGNNNPTGRRLDLFPRYPANWGGESDRPNIISVGAIDTAGNKASFSNFGDEVDIYAPGCSLRTIDDNNTEVIDFGTSMAAAHVSFVSSLIRALGGTSMWPARIKERLIASADFAPSFPEIGKQGYKLNEVKAISITHDVIEVSDAGGNGTDIRFGKIRDPNSLRQYCSGDAKLMLDNVQKVTPNINYNGTTFILYLAAPNGVLGEILCEQENENVPLPGYIEDGIAVPDIMITDVVDVVIASLRL